MDKFRAIRGAKSKSSMINDFYNLINHNHNHNVNICFPLSTCKVSGIKQAKTTHARARNFCEVFYKSRNEYDSRHLPTTPPLLSSAFPNQCAQCQCQSQCPCVKRKCNA
eukprot:scaffold105638_cov32-Tisochrysis_lutea.AAC.5